jgi:hypothetical protein
MAPVVLKRDPVVITRIDMLLDREICADSRTAPSEFGLDARLRKESVIQSPQPAAFSGLRAARLTPVPACDRQHRDPNSRSSLNGWSSPREYLLSMCGSVLGQQAWRREY